MSDIAAGALPVSTGPETTDYLVGEFSGATGRAEISAILALGGGSSGGGGSSTLGGDTDVDFTNATAGAVLGVNPISFGQRQRVSGTISGGGTLTVALTEAALQNSLLVAYVATEGGAPGGGSITAPPTGFSLVIDQAAQDGGGIASYVFQKRASGGETSVAISVGTNYSGGAVLVVEEWAGAQSIGSTSGVNYATGVDGGTVTITNVPAGAVVVALQETYGQPDQGPVSGYSDFYLKSAGNAGMNLYEQTVETEGSVSFTFTQSGNGPAESHILLAIPSAGNKPYAFVPQSSGGGGSSYPGVSLVNDFNNSSTPSFTPTIGQKYTFVCEYTLTTASQNMRAQLETPSTQSFEVAIINNSLAAANYTGSSTYETTYNVGGSAGLGKRTITMEFCVYAGNLIDFRGFCDGFYAGGFYQVALTELSGQPLTPYYYTDSPTPTSAKLYEGWLVTEIADALTSVSSSGGSSSGSTTPYDSVVLSQSPAHYWPLNDAAGATSAADMGIGTAAPLTQQGTVTFGAPGLALDGETSVLFPGVPGSYLQMPAEAQPAGNFTLSLILLPANTLNGTDQQFAGFDIVATDGVFLAKIHQNAYSYSQDQILNITGVAAAGSYRTHVAYAYNSSSTLMTIYVNGIPSFTNTATLTASTTAGSFGSSPPSGTNSFFGRMAKIGLWNSLLTQAQIFAQVKAAGL
jgi:hypothetical protein